MNRNIKPLEIFQNSPTHDLWDHLSSVCKEHFAERTQGIKVLEAGCGRTWNLDLKGLKYSLTGLDVSKEALEIRKNQTKDLDEVIHGDLQTVDIPQESFDLVFCSYVLEHIDAADVVLERLFMWLKPQGLLVLLIPDRNTVYGAITRLSPHWFHVFFYRYFLKKKNAGKPGFGPFETYYRKIVSREGIVNYCALNNHRIKLEYGLKVNSKRMFGSLAPMANVTMKSLSAFSAGKLAHVHNDLVYAIEKS